MGKCQSKSNTKPNLVDFIATFNDEIILMDLDGNVIACSDVFLLNFGLNSLNHAIDLCDIIDDYSYGSIMEGLSSLEDVSLTDITVHANTKKECKISPCMGGMYKTVTFTPQKKNSLDLEAQNSSLTQLSHELRQVFQMISYDDPSKIPTVQLVTGVKNANEIVSNSMVIGKIFNKTYKPNIKSVNIIKIINALVEIFPKDPGIIVQTMSDTYIFETDVFMFKCAVRNIISNAVKYSPKDEEVTITINETKSSGGLSISIKDKGNGIAKKNMDDSGKAWNHDKKKGSSNGLGLHFVHKILGLLHGDVKMTSVKGEGTIVTLFFPLKGKTENCGRKKRCTPSTVSGGSRRLVNSKKRRSSSMDEIPGVVNCKTAIKHVRVLVMDDNVIICKILTNMLTNLGYRDVKSCFGYSQLEGSINDYDLYFVDHDMGSDLNGLEVSAIIRREEAKKVVSISGTELFNPIYDHILQKPISVNDLVSITNNYYFDV